MTHQPLKLNPAQVSVETGESISVVYSAIARGDLKSFLVGRRRWITPEDMRAWVDFLRAESDAGRPVSYRSREALNDPRARRAS